MLETISSYPERCICIFNGSLTIRLFIIEKSLAREAEREGTRVCDGVMAMMTLLQRRGYLGGGFI